MARFSGIQNVLNRINAIQSKFKPPTAFQSFKPTQISFNMSLKKAMGAQNATQVGYSTGPSNLQALLSRMGAASMMMGGIGGAAGEKLAQIAKEMAGKHFKPGQTARCADFVSTMIEKAGIAPPNFKHEVNCYRLQKYGKRIDGVKNLKPGDVVFFDYTYLPTTYTHTGIYIGNGKFVHRPTANAPVRIDDLTKGYWREKFNSARRLTA